MSAIEGIIGRYVRLDVGGKEQRIYFEEAGSGIPLVCLHTAGADSRQYYHLMNDPEVLSRFRVIAFDLPWHGKSFPPDMWWEQEYLLTSEIYLQTVLAVLDALELDRPIVMGCSMAGSFSLELARLHPERIKAVISLSGASAVRGRFQDWSLSSVINAQQSVASWTYSLMAPGGVEKAMREVWWGYAQGGPGVYRGDTYFYSEDSTLAGHEAEIDVNRCPVYMLTGEYDYACSAEETEETRNLIPGAKGMTLDGLGHFPMAENYPLFRSYLLPILEEIW